MPNNVIDITERIRIRLEEEAEIEMIKGLNLFLFGEDEWQSRDKIDWQKIYRGLK